VSDELVERVATEIMYLDGRFFDGKIPAPMARAFATAVIALIKHSLVEEWERRLGESVRKGHCDPQALAEAVLVLREMAKEGT
jgi:hypothetical protein